MVAERITLQQSVWTYDDSLRKNSETPTQL